jgi:hypothetical protein
MELEWLSGLLYQTRSIQSGQKPMAKSRESGNGGKDGLDPKDERKAVFHRISYFLTAVSPFPRRDERYPHWTERLIILRLRVVASAINQRKGIR